MLDREKNILKTLAKTYPDAPKTSLHYETPLQILVATILSAQCTDKRVNIVTKDLFKKYETVHDYAAAKQIEFEKDIKSSGFYRSKAKNIIAAAKKIEVDFAGEVPTNMDDLLSLPGVARKTANIVLFAAFDKVEGIAVDTHVRRISYRLGLTKNRDPAKIEKDLMAAYPKKQWSKINKVFIEHGRNVCTSRKPKCTICPVERHCPKIDVRN